MQNKYFVEALYLDLEDCKNRKLHSDSTQPVNVDRRIYIHIYIYIYIYSLRPGGMGTAGSVKPVLQMIICQIYVIFQGCIA